VPWPQVYWFWRDRKGLVGNLLTPLDNLLLLYSVTRYGHLVDILPAWFAICCQVTFFIAVLQTGMRTQSAAGIYGWKFAALAPLRVVWANLVNCAATVRAIGEYGLARWAGVGVAWKKTEHTYPVNPQWAPQPDPAPHQ